MEKYVGNPEFQWGVELWFLIHTGFIKDVVLWQCDSMVESLKTLWIAQYICMKDAHSWRVYSTETNSSSPIPNFISSPYIAGCGLSGSNRHAHNLKIWTVASDLPWTQSHVCLPIKPLYSHSARRRMERNWGSHHWNASLHATDSLMMIVSL